MAFPYTATYQSWNPQLVAGSVDQLGPTIPGFDEHEKHPVRDSSWQAADAARMLLPCAATSSIPPSSEQHLAAGGLATNVLATRTYNCPAGLVHGGPTWFPNVLPAGQLDFVTPQYRSSESHSEYHDSAAAACPTEQLHTSTHYAASSAFGPNTVGCRSDKGVHPYSTLPYVTASEANNFQLNPCWDSSSCSPQHNVAVGWPVPGPAAAMHQTSSALVSTQTALGDCQTEVTALPVQQQQLQEQQGCTTATPPFTKDSQEASSLHLQTSCSGGTVPALRAWPCMVLAGKPRPAAVDIRTADQSSQLARDAYCQQHLNSTDVHMLAATAAHHDCFEQVMLAARLLL